MAKWIPTWHYVPIDYHQELGLLENISQKCVFTNNLDGTMLRLRFNNLYSNTPMVINQVSVALHNRITGFVSPCIPVSLHGRTSIFLPANSSPYSDPLAITITPQEDILVYMHFAQKTILHSVCTTYTGIGWQSTHQTGNFYRPESLGFTRLEQLAAPLAQEPYSLQFAAGLCEVSILTSDDVQLIALFGDSITHMSYFMDPFLERLYTKFPGKCAVMNVGISGNRIQKSHPLCPDFPSAGFQFGLSGKDRFQNDVYGDYSPDIVFVMEGINDCTHSLCFQEPQIPTAMDIFDALKDITLQAKSHGSRIYIGTISPFAAFGEDWRNQAEFLRCEYNYLIRTSQISDGIVDIDAALRDPQDIHRMQEGFHLGDGIHPNWIGGIKMAEALMSVLF